MSRIPVDPNAIYALNRMKYEIANELGLSNSFGNNPSDIDYPVQNMFFAGHVGGNMTKRLVEMAERQLIDKSK